MLPRHRSMGVPRYVSHPNPLRRAFEGLRKKAFRLVSDVAKALGVSATTLRRMEAAGSDPEGRARHLRKRQGGPRVHRCAGHDDGAVEGRRAVAPRAPREVAADVTAT